MLNVLLRILLVCVCLTVAAEIGVRSLIVAPASIEEHPELGWIYSAGARVLHTSEGYASHTMNALGLNDAEPPPSSEPVVVVLGDSFVESLQLDASLNFTSLLESSSRCAHVLNAGRSGISPLHFPAMLAHVDASNQIDGVVATVGPGDFHDIKNARLAIKRNAGGDIESLGFTAAELNPLRKKLDGLLRHSALATYLLNRLKAARAPTNVPAPATPGRDNKATEQHEKIAGDVLIHTFMQLPRKNSIVLYLPGITYLENRIAQPTEQSDRFLRLVQRSADSAGIRVVDTTDALIDLYLSQGQPGHGFANSSATSGHLNVSGHRAVAQVLAEALATFTVCQ